MCESQNPTTINAPVCFEKQGTIYTNSMSVAICFKKRHDHVISAIRELIAACPPEFGIPNFGETSYTDSCNRKQALYELTFDGFMLLAMGFTGEKALQVKLAYIAEFNRMRSLLDSKKALEPVRISPEQCAKLRLIADSKLGAYPNEIRRKAYPEMWSRFNRHFGISKYSELPADKLDEAIDHLIRMEIRATENYGMEEIPASIANEADTIHKLRMLVCDLIGRSNAWFTAYKIALEKLIR